MRNGSKPTREQRIVLSRNGLDPYDLLAVKSVGKGWLFRSRTDPSSSVVCYPDKKGVYLEDGVTQVEGYICDEES